MVLSACTPTYDWRTVQGAEAPYTILLPAKPSTHVREVNLGGIRASMTMQAAEAGNIIFAIGTAELPDAAQARAAIQVMKNTMVSNIDGFVRVEKDTSNDISTTIDLIAGPRTHAQTSAAGAKTLHARFVAQGRRVYQVIMVGPEKSIQTDTVDTFFDSFKTN